MNTNMTSARCFENYTLGDKGEEKISTGTAPVPDGDSYLKQKRTYAFNASSPWSGESCEPDSDQSLAEIYFKSISAAPSTIDRKNSNKVLCEQEEGELLCWSTLLPEESCGPTNQPKFDENIDSICHSIFELPQRQIKSVHFPKILEGAKSFQIERGNIPSSPHSCALPKIGKEGSQSKQAQLFDYHQPDIQKRARKTQVRKLKQSGLGAGGALEIGCRFTVLPYEGACDNFTKVSELNQRNTLHKSVNQKNKDSENKQTKGSEQVYSTNVEKHKSVVQDIEGTAKSPDEITLAKIENAFKNWHNKKQQEINQREEENRKRSYSLSSDRSLCTESRSTKSENSSPSLAPVSRLDQKGNLRHPPKDAKTYTDTSSPVCFRRQKYISCAQSGPITQSLNTIARSTTTLPSPTVNKRRQHPTASPLLERHRQYLSPGSPLLLKNKTLARISIENKEFLSSSLPDLNSDKPDFHEDMNIQRPRASSLHKAKASPGGNSPATKKRLSKVKQKTPVKDKNKKESGNEVEEPSPQVSRRVMLNTSLPTASPTFQRAMKGMQIPDKDYSKIFEADRKDTIIQDYQIAENAFKSFRDDHDMTGKSLSKDALEEMTNRFRADFRDYKSGWNSETESKTRKSILKKRRQSVDDMEISTRRNLSKYLESKLNVSDTLEASPTRQLRFQ